MIPARTGRARPGLLASAVLPHVPDSQSSCGFLLLPYGKLAAQREVHGSFGMKPGRVEHGNIKIILPDQHGDLGAAEDHAVSAALTQILDLSYIFVLGVRLHDALAEFLI